jgi:uncharacterized protein (TIGR00159 family)
MPWWGALPDNIRNLLLHSLDLGLVCAFIYLMLLIIGERRTLWMVRGLLILMLTALIGERLKLTILSFFLEKLVLVSALSMAIVFQSDFRRFLEQLGRGHIKQFFPAKSSLPKEDTVIDEIVDAVKDLSQNRTGALILLETFNTLDERVFVNRGVRLSAEVSKELLQTIFQTKTLLHDGAVFIRGSEIVAASVILPLSERSASRQLGTRHRAAMGITERVENCLCIVVSEETGSISLGEKGILNRPLTSTKLKELLEEKLSPLKEGEVVTGVSRLSRTIGFQGWNLLRRFFNFGPSQSRKKLREK